MKVFVYWVLLAGVWGLPTFANATHSTNVPDLASLSARYPDPKAVADAVKKGLETPDPIKTNEKALSSIQKKLTSASDIEGDLKRHPELADALKNGDLNELNALTGAKTDPDKKSNAQALAEYYAKKNIAGLKNYVADMETNKSRTPNKVLDDAITDKLKGLAEKHKALLGEFEGAGVKGASKAAIAVRLEEMQQKLDAKDYQGAGKLAGELLPTLSKRGALAQALTGQSDNNQAVTLTSTLREAAYLSEHLKTGQSFPINRAVENGLSADMRNFRQGFADEWKREGGGAARLTRFSQLVHEGNTKELDTEFPGWGDFALRTGNVEAAWLHGKKSDGTWKYEQSSIDLLREGTWRTNLRLYTASSTEDIRYLTREMEGYKEPTVALAAIANRAIISDLISNVHETAKAIRNLDIDKLRKNSIDLLANPENYAIRAPATENQIVNTSNENSSE